MPSNVILEQLFLEASKDLVANTNSIRENLYPHVKDSLDKPKIRNEYKKCLGNFMERRSEAMYDNLPIARILFSNEDVNNLFKALNLDISLAEAAIDRTYYGNEPNFSPLAAKDPFTVTMLCVIKYFLEKNMQKEAEMATIHLSFSGKFYPSLHYRSYPIPPARHVMEYVVNNELSNKFDLVQEGSIIGCIRKIGNTWLQKYKPIFKSLRDEDIKYLIDQLYSRIGSFHKNIARVYHPAYKEGKYLAYSSDSLSEDDYHLSNSDLIKMNTYLEKSINYITNTGVDYSICKMCSDENITVNEIKSIIESIMAEPSNIPKVKEMLSLMIVTYLQQAKNSEKDVANVAFITYCMAPKPNAKQKEIVRQKDIIEELLVDNSKTYIRRKSRLATKNSYERAMRLYFGLSIHNANR